MNTIDPATTDNPFVPEALADFQTWLRSQTPEELAERMTTYQASIPHYWHGQPINPISKEELLSRKDNLPESRFHEEQDLPESSKANVR